MSPRFVKPASTLPQAIVCLRVIQIVQGLAAIGGSITLFFVYYFFVAISEMPKEAQTSTLLLLACGFVILLLCFFVITEWAIRGLHKRKFVAWVTAIVIFCFAITSFIFPVGILGIIFLVPKAVRSEFRKSRGRADAPRKKKGDPKYRH